MSAMDADGGPIVLSDDEECVDLDLMSSDSEPEVVGASWTCAVCKNVNSQFAGDCTECGAAPGAEPPVDLEADAVDKGIDLAEALEAYLRTGGGDAGGGKALLDACGCAVHRDALRSHVRELTGSMPAMLDALAAHFACPACGKELTRRDLVWALGDAACAEIDEHCFDMVLAAAATGSGAGGSGGSNRSKKARTQPHPACGTAHLVVASIETARQSLGIKGRQDAASAAGSSRGARGKGGGGGSGKKAAGGGAGIPKGTGYGGCNGRWNPRAAATGGPPAAEVARAREAEGQADAQTAAALKAIETALEEPCCSWERAGAGAAPPSGGSAKQRRSAPLLVACALHGSPIAFLLRRLLANDSLLDIGQRDRLYWAAVQLLQFLGKCPEFVLALLKPAPDPCDEAGPEGGPSVLQALATLNLQCQVFVRSADDLTSEEENKALGLALEIGSVHDELSRAGAATRLTRTLGSAGSGGGGSSADAAAAEERSYVEAMAPHRFRHWPMVVLGDFYFRKEQAKAGGALKRGLLRLGQEISSLATSVPVSSSSSVLLVVDDARMDMMRACIIGPQGTPYENGAFVFDIWLPPNYPEVPPKVQFLTTGGGRVRFNPNLYDCGKVCLSLLGTWQGPSWDPATSTILQVLVSIQSMIFVEDPYFNEPGYESSAGSASGKAQSESYNRSIRRHTLAHALLPALRKPPAAFKDALRVHFELKKGAILRQLEQWTARDGTLGALAAEIRACLQPPDA